MRITRLLRYSGGLAPVFLSMGCYTQQPLQTTVPAPQTRIVAEVTDSGTVAMSNAIGAGSVEIEGVITGADGDAWNVQLIRVDHRNGSSVPWNRETVSFPRYALTNVMERRLDTRRSWVTAGVVTASAILLGHLFQLVASDEGEDKPPIPAEIVLPPGGRWE